jgi:hypothetical protein
MLYKLLKINLSIIIQINLIDNFIKILTSARSLLVNYQTIDLPFINQSITI